VRISVFPKGDLDDILAGRLALTDWIRAAAGLGVDGVELYSRFFLDADDTLVDEVAGVLAETGLAMPMLCASPDLAHPDPAVRAAEREAEERMIMIAARLGGPGVACRVLSGQRHPGVSRDEGVTWVVEAITALLPLAHEQQVVLAMENHYKDGLWRYPEFAQDPDVFCTIIDAIEDRVGFGVQYDPSNATMAGTDPVAFLDRVIDRVVTMQASDRRLADGASLADLAAADGSAGYAAVLEHGVIGTGLNDYPAIFTRLVAAGYDGWISIEDGVGGWDDLRASVAFLADARERYFGGSRAVRVPESPYDLEPDQQPRQEH